MANEDHPYWIPKSPVGLTFYDERKYSDGYGNFTRKLIKVNSNLISYLKDVQDNPKTHFLVIKCLMNGRTIAMVDCDSLKDIELATNHLDSKGLGYAVFSSSEGKGWVFPGFSFSSFEAAHAAVGAIPGCDQRYRKIAKDRGCFVVRGECKKSQRIPELIKCQTKESCVSLFVKSLDEHFKSPVFQELHKFRTSKDSFSRVCTSYSGY